MFGKVSSFPKNNTRSLSENALRSEIDPKHYFDKRDSRMIKKVRLCFLLKKIKCQKHNFFLLKIEIK